MGDIARKLVVHTFGAPRVGNDVCIVHDDVTCRCWPAA